MANPPILTLQSMALTYGVTPLLSDASLTVSEGDRICLVGRNGSGKSTFLKIAAGLVEADSGERFIHPGATVRYLEQDPDLTEYSNVFDYVRAGLAPGDDEHQALYYLNALGLTGDEGTDKLSGGERRRAALARALAPAPDLLLLDEPTNHLDLPAIEWLEGELKACGSALVLISHDRRFLSNLSRKTVWLDRGMTQELNKGFAAFEDWRDDLLEKEAEEQHKLSRQIAREEHWVRYGVTARRKRNVRRMRELAELRQKHKTHEKSVGLVSIEQSDAGKTGKRVVEAADLAKAFGDNVLVRDFSIRIERGEKIGLIGPNGAGKTTLLKMLIGELEPDAGEIRFGTNLEIATLDQHRAALNPEWTVKDALSPGGDMVEVGGQTRHVMSYMKDFLFRPEQAGTPVETLSGGEKARLLLARALARPSNVLVLDEPTNDLDLETLDLLEDFIANYSGTVILITHDRDFLDRIAERVIAPEGGGHWQIYAGGYSDMIAQRGSDLASRKAVKSSTPARTGTSSAPKTEKRKMANKDRYTLEKLPGEIDQLGEEIASLETELASPDLFTRDPERFNAASKALAYAQASLDDKETLWLELEALREEIEAENG
ncbi:ATP-binding cassette domain-containing protein [Hyphobacterium sp. HN65]|uniref:ATP-binding cassette domain-containing protein n=1 Tax=Hyphobacterium lacteum TaxID=3116575 RepID=A0ABU7LQ60_9PROT|nr:ATP-binding cassette domain-containing protein [Hyphobacterium sp. HN65]MEE2525766.1 ATP-binding cassette domain-containing protein [Hyphobacterium sp. HN65]